MTFERKEGLRMSVLLEKPVESTTTSQQVIHRPLRRHVPATQPIAPMREQAVERVKQKPKTNVAAVVAMKAGLFVSVMGLVYGASSLGGQVMVESARQQRIEAIERAADARGAVVSLNRQLDRLTGHGGIDRWALGHQFKSPDGFGSDHAHTLVAHR
jgi:hypothetical protein